MTINLNSTNVIEGLERTLLEEGKLGLSLVSYAVLMLKAEGASRGESMLKEFFITRNGGKVTKGLIYPNSNDYRIIKAAQTLSKKEGVAIEKAIAEANSLSQAVTGINTVLSAYTVNGNIWFCGEYLPVLMTAKSAEVIQAEYDAKRAVEPVKRVKDKDKDKDKGEGASDSELLETSPQPKTEVTFDIICKNWLSGFKDILEKAKDSREGVSAVVGLVAKLDIILKNTSFADEEITLMQGMLQGILTSFHESENPIVVLDSETEAVTRLAA